MNGKIYNTIKAAAMAVVLGTGVYAQQQTPVQAPQPTMTVEKKLVGVKPNTVYNVTAEGPGAGLTKDYGNLARVVARDMYNAKTPADWSTASKMNSLWQTTANICEDMKASGRDCNSISDGEVLKVKTDAKGVGHLYTGTEPAVAAAQPAAPAKSIDTLAVATQAATPATKSLDSAVAAVAKRDREAAKQKIKADGEAAKSDDLIRIYYDELAAYAKVEPEAERALKELLTDKGFGPNTIINIGPKSHMLYIKDATKKQGRQLKSSRIYEETVKALLKSRDYKPNTK
jgi:hypothetical protein